MNLENPTEIYLLNNPVFYSSGLDSIHPESSGINAFSSSKCFSQYVWVTS